MNELTVVWKNNYYYAVDAEKHLYYVGFVTTKKVNELMEGSIFKKKSGFVCKTETTSEAYPDILLIEGSVQWLDVNNYGYLEMPMFYFQEWMKELDTANDIVAGIAYAEAKRYFVTVNSILDWAVKQ